MSSSPLGSAQSRSLSDGHLLARNVVWNAASEVAPLAIALFATPVLLRRLGIERFGVLALGWTIFGFFGFFDLGLGSAVIKLCSDRLAARREHQVAVLIRTCLLMLLATGSIAALALLAICGPLVHHLLKVPVGLQGETQHAFYIMAISLPLVVSVRAYWGALAAYQRFDRIAIVQSLKAIFLSAAPVVTALISNRLPLIFLVIAAGHSLFWILYLAVTSRVVSGLTDSGTVDRKAARELITFGGWSAAGSAANLMMMSLDRSMLGAMVSMEAVAYYAVPLRIVARLRVVPQIFGGVLYPAFTHSLGADRDRTVVLFDRGVKSLFLVMFPATVIATVFAPELLAFWLGPQFGPHTVSILRWLAVAALLGGATELPHTLLAAAHRPDIAAITSLLESVPFWFGLRWCIATYGATGAAIALAARMGIDALLALGIASVLMPQILTGVRRFALALSAGIVTLALSTEISGLFPKTLFAAAAVSIFFLAAWRWLCLPEDRRAVRQYLRALTSAVA